MNGRRPAARSGGCESSTRGDSRSRSTDWPFLAAQLWPCGLCDDGGPSASREDSQRCPFGPPFASVPWERKARSFPGRRRGWASLSRCARGRWRWSPAEPGAGGDVRPAADFIGGRRDDASQTSSLPRLPPRRSCFGSCLIPSRLMALAFAVVSFSLIASTGTKTTEVRACFWASVSFLYSPLHKSSGWRLPHHGALLQGLPHGSCIPLLARRRCDATTNSPRP